MRNGYTINRILLVSPHQNEMVRRNQSRIFIASGSESQIDSILFSGLRHTSDFTEVAAVAVAMAGLADASGTFGLRTQVNPSVTNAGVLPMEHFITNGWLEDKTKKVYDMYIEVLIENENLPEVDMKTSNALAVDGVSDNPLIIAIDDIAQLVFRESDDGNEQGEPENGVAQNFDRAGTEDESQAGESDVAGNGRGQVKNPETDRRLKQNRDQSETAMARRSETDSDGATAQSGRMAGKPGRVRDPSLDMRISSNRAGFQAHQAAVGGR